MRLKAVVLSSYNLISRWVVKHKYSNYQRTWTPWHDPHVLFMRNSWDFRQGMGGDIVSVIYVCTQCGPRSCSTDPNCLKLWRYFWFFFHIHFLETKAPKRLPVCRLVWTFVVRMYQRRISRDKVHMIFNNSQLNVNVYTSYTPPRHLCRGVYSFRLSDCPFVLSYVR